MIIEDIDEIEDFEEDMGNEADRTGKGTDVKGTQEPIESIDSGEGESGDGENGTPEGENPDLEEPLKEGEGEEGEGEESEGNEEGEGGEEGEGESERETEGTGEQEAEGEVEEAEGEGEGEETGEEEGESEGEDKEEDKDEVPEPPEDEEFIESLVEEILLDVCGYKVENIRSFIALLPRATRGVIEYIHDTADELNRIPRELFELDKQGAKSLLLWINNHKAYLSKGKQKLNFSRIIFDEFMHQNIWVTNVVTIDDHIFIAKISDNQYNIYNKAQDNSKVTKIQFIINKQEQAAIVTGESPVVNQYIITEIIGNLKKWQEEGAYNEHVNHSDLSEKLLKLSHEFITFVKSGV